ncbi:pyridoxal-phosphate-dependent aminotransferase family protein [Marinomonas ostreistagni]|uniref:pyridoxal-phosphate-dependent aminotransferase family protein n=1 Tax=Marinomonas ostreistagni TaxID=359209 RepID=UPI001951E3F9|nr:alanine--glyoxylate aminotransferase family protein [Marinomonas ostreistagni]MBM6551965.1 alanine--glyoxylate aminotransferase family protein [Marinomonas ostreistagni]
MDSSTGIPVPQLQSLYDILPQEPLLMMGAGPVPIPERVAKANSVVINHLGGTMATVIDQVKRMARYVFQTQSKWVLGVAGPASAAMEMTAVNLLQPGEKILCLNNGFFSHRMAEMASRVGADVHELHIPVHEAANPDRVRKAIEQVRPKVISMVQGETSNTVCNYTLKDIAAIAKEYGCLVVVDAVCTLSTMPLKMDEWQVDVVITGGQKGLSSIPGVSLVAFSDDAWHAIEQRTTPLTHWCFDVKLAENFWHRDGYHYTAPVSGIMALHEALKLVCEETLEQRFARHLRCSKALQAGIEGMGLELFIEPEARLNSVVGISIPEGLTAKQICAHISETYRVEIAGSFGQPIVRIGQMGEQCREHNLFRTLHALGSTMRDLGVKVDQPNGMAEMESFLQSTPRFIQQSVA